MPAPAACTRPGTRGRQVRVARFRVVLGRCRRPVRRARLLGETPPHGTLRGRRPGRPSCSRASVLSVRTPGRRSRGPGGAEPCVAPGASAGVAASCRPQRPPVPALARAPAGGQRVIAGGVAAEMALNASPAAAW